MLGREKTSLQDRASYSLKTHLTFENGLWDNLTYFCFCFLFFHTPKSLLFFFCTVSWSQFIWPLSCSPRQEYTFSLYSSPQMMEINSHKRSGPLWQAEPPARGSSDPFERQTKAKDFCPLCLLLKSHWKSAHAFSNLRHSSFIDALFFFVGKGIDKGMYSLGGVCGTGMVSVPWIKPSLFSASTPFYFYSWHH